jgi:hypothetical protein
MEASKVRLDLSAVRREKAAEAESAIRAFIDHHVRSEDMGLLSVTATQALVMDAETRGYYATYSPKAKVLTDVFHIKYGYGQLMALDIDLPGVRLEQIRTELQWAAFSSPAGDPLESPAIISGGPGKADLKPWLPRLCGPGSFIGIFREEQKSKALLVAYSSSLPNQAANKQAIASHPPQSHAEFAAEALQQKLRRKQQRNCMRVLHDAAIAIGCQSDADRTAIEDADAAPGDGKIVVPGVDPRRAAMAALQKKPMMTVPQIHDEMDLMIHCRRLGVVEYFDGVASVAAAAGGLVTFENGSPESGIRVMTDLDNCKQRFWDGGYTGAAGWKTPEDVVKSCPLYKAVLVVRAP